MTFCKVLFSPVFVLRAMSVPKLGLRRSSGLSRGFGRVAVWLPGLYPLCVDRNLCCDVPPTAGTGQTRTTARSAPSHTSCAAWACVWSRTIVETWRTMPAASWLRRTSVSEYRVTWSGAGVGMSGWATTAHVILGANSRELQNLYGY